MILRIYCFLKKKKQYPHSRRIRDGTGGDWKWPWSLPNYKKNNNFKAKKKKVKKNNLRYFLPIDPLKIFLGPWSPLKFKAGSVPAGGINRNPETTVTFLI